VRIGWNRRDSRHFPVVLGNRDWAARSLDGRDDFRGPVLQFLDADRLLFVATT
jgi:hypothetical protein